MALTSPRLQCCACVLRQVFLDLLLLRPTAANRALVAALAAFDGAVAAAKQARDWPLVGRIIDRVRRG